MRFSVSSTRSETACGSKFFAGCFGIFGHGNVAGLGQALLQSELQNPGALPYHQGRNEQAMVHIAVGYARQKDRLQTFAVTASGPGASNMVTGAALATINRLPVLLLPSDIFATRVASPGAAGAGTAVRDDVSVNDAFRPVSGTSTGSGGPSSCPAALLGGDAGAHRPGRDRRGDHRASRRTCRPRRTTGRSSCSPSGSGASPGRCRSPRCSPRAAEVDPLRAGPMIVSGGGVTYAGANEALDAFVEATGIPVGETQAGKGSLPFDHPQYLGAIGATGTTAANALAREADVVIGIGTRYSDFTTASRTVFQNPDVRFVNINVAAARRGQARRVCRWSGRRPARR